MEFVACYHCVHVIEFVVRFHHFLHPRFSYSLFFYQFDMINGMPANSLKRRLEAAVADADARLREEMRATETQSGGESASGSRGNLRQRFERASAIPPSSSSSTGPARPFPLVESLKRHWAAGRLSSPMVQDIATGAAAQGATGGG